MAKVKVIFVGGDTVIDKTIKTVTNGQYSHVAIQTTDPQGKPCIYEASGIPDEIEKDPYPGVWRHRADKYDGNPYAKFISIDLPDKEAADAWAESKVGTLYAYPGCVLGGLHDLTGVNLPLDGELTMNCSEFSTRFLREGSLDILHGLFADGITPMDDERALEGTA
jgi:hypothetical protein